MILSALAIFRFDGVITAQPCGGLDCFIGVHSNFGTICRLFSQATTGGLLVGGS
jgi:hypothetical protein